MTALDPELDVAAAALVAEGAQCVVVGGFAVIANRFIRATEDIDLLVPDDDDNDARIIAALCRLSAMRLHDRSAVDGSHLLGVDHLRVRSDAGLIDIIREGRPPLDYATVAGRALRADYGGVEILVASLRSIVGFKRLAGRPRDRNDLEQLEAIHGLLPIDPIPGLDG